jgi:fucose permease
VLAAAAARFRSDSLVVFVGFVALGLPLGTLGVAWPAMREELGAPIAGLGFLLSGLTLAEAGSSALAGPVMRHAPTTLVLSASALGAAVALAVIASASAWPVAVAGAILLGAAIGFLDVGVNAYGALTQGIRYLGSLHGSWAVGAALGPPAVGIAVAAGGSWRLGFVLIALVFLVVGATLARSGVRAPPEEHAASTRTRLAPVALGCLAFFLYVGVEVGAGSWSFVRLTDAAIASAAAGAAVTAYWSMLAFTRLALGAWGERAAPERLLDIALATTAVAGVLGWILPIGLSAFVALPLLGGAIGTIIPLLVYLTPRRVGRSATSAVLGLQFAAAMLGGATIPAGLGYLIERQGSGTLAPAIAALCLGIAAVHLAARIDDRRREGPSGDRARARGRARGLRAP